MSILIPQAAQQTPHDALSQRYLAIPSTELIKAIEGSGFDLVEQKIFSRRTDPFAKHLLKFQYKDDSIRVFDSKPEVIVINSHDGTSSLRVILGMLRLVCTNGLIVGETYDQGVFRHRTAESYTLNDVVTRVEKMAQGFVDVLEDVRWMNDIELTPAERQRFAEGAMALRWYDREPLARVEDVLTPKREEDSGTDLWTTFNVVQENLTKGFHSVNLATLKPRTIRSIRGSEMDVWFNRKLWDLASEFRIEA